jgi:hypothetical protein
VETLSKRQGAGSTGSNTRKKLPCHVGLVPLLSRMEKKILLRDAKRSQRSTRVANRPKSDFCQEYIIFNL